MASSQATQVSKPSIISFKTSALLTIRVGQAPNTEDFAAHESILTSRSEFFRRAMNGNWKEAETRIISLSHDEPNTFALYINYVYTEHLSISTKTKEERKTLKHDDFQEYVGERYHTIFSIFVLSEKLQDLATKNALMEVALATAKLKGPDGSWQAPCVETVNMVYDGTPPNSTARRFMTDFMTALLINHIFANFKQFHEDLVKDLGESMGNHWKAVSASIGNIPERKGVAAYEEKPKEK